MGRKRARQGHLAGMDPPSIKAIDDAADIYFDAMQRRVALSQEEHEAKDNLIDKMKENDQTIYTTADGLVVTVTATSNVRCKRKNDEETEDEE